EHGVSCNCFRLWRRPASGKQLGHNTRLGYQMNVLFITAHHYLPQMYGGLQTSTDEFCHSLLAKGHSVAVLAALLDGRIFSLEQRTQMKVNRLLHGHKVACSRRLGYPVWYSWFPWEHVSYVASRVKPD